MENLVKTITKCIKYQLFAGESGKKTNHNEQVVAVDISADFFSELYRLSVKHDIANMVGDALIKNGQIENSNIKSRFQKQIAMSVYRCENINYEFGRLCVLLENEHIEFIPLKGAVLKNYYPAPWMRTSCDIDILVHNEDLQKAKVVFKEKLGYTCDREEKGSHDVLLCAPNGVHLELHYTLIEEGKLLKADKILSDIWNYVEESDSYQKKLSDEAFYFYHIAHMVKHFLIGGCGIKPFADLWVLNHNNVNGKDKEKRDSLLLKGGLLKFAKETEKLSEIWFGEEEHTQTTEKIENYILQGGVYGTMQNRVVVQQVKSGGKIRYNISRIWLPYDTIKFLYPVLQKHKWMLPFCQVKRWFKLLFKGGFKRSADELSTSSSITEEQRKEISNLLSELGI